MRSSILALLLLASPALVRAQELGVEQALGLARAGRVAEAEAALRARLERTPDEVAARLALGQVLDWEGRREEAAALLEVAGAPVRALSFAARLRLEQGREGPLVVHRRGHALMLASRDAAREAAWQAERRALAAQDLARVLALEPDQPGAALALSELLAEQGHRAAALALLEAQRARRTSAPLLTRLGWLRLEAGRGDEAAEAFTRALGLDPRADEALAGLARVREAQGRSEEAAALREQAAFLAWAPRFLELEHEPASWARARALTEDEVSPAEVEALAADPSPRTTRLLAAFVWHRPQGPAGARAFELLGRRADAGPVLGALLDNARQPGTVRGVLWTAARERLPGALPLLLQLLPHDLAPQDALDVAGALAALGDPGAVPGLVAVLGARAPAGAADDPLAALERQGLLEARRRAALALGRLGGPAARDALERAAADPELRPTAQSALRDLTEPALPEPERALPAQQR